MQIGGVSSQYIKGFHVSFGSASKKASSAASSVTTQDQVNFLYREVVKLRKALEAIRNPLRLRQYSHIRYPAQAISMSNLNLSLGSATVLKSTEEVNALPTSFSPFGPDWNGTSSALATIDGIYDGSNGTQTLTFRVSKDGEHGNKDLKIQIRDENDITIENITIDKNDPIDKQYALSNGLIFTLGAGSLEKHDTFALNVYDSVGSIVDPDKALNGTRNDNPNLEYGLSVTDGSFEINGTIINVFSTDSINTVLDRITQSDAGVTASFDAATESVVLTQKTLGAEPIDLANDSSGFFAATKLSGATAVLGEKPDAEKIVENVAPLSSIQSGTISINGTDIAIDVTSDTLNDIISRINSSDAGVKASLNWSHQRLSIVAENPQQPMELDSGTTGFFPALKITDQIYNPIIATDSSRESMSKIKASSIADSIARAAEAFSAIFNAKKVQKGSDEALSDFVSNLRSDLQSAVSSAFDSESTMLNTGYGIHFDFNDKEGRTFEFSLVDSNELINKLSKDGTEVNDLFFGKKRNREDGLLEKILTALESSEAVLKDVRGTSGVFVDIKV